MKLIKRLIDSAKYALKGSQGRKYPDTYLGELEFQNKRLLPLTAFICLFTWLPYVPIDKRSFPDEAYLPYIRFGLTGLSLLLLALRNFNPWRYWHLALHTLLATYIVVAGGVAALLSAADPAYIGGFFICLTLTALLGPVPYLLMALVLLIGYLTFFLGLWVLKIELQTNSQKYSIQDLGTVILITYVLGYVQHRIRKSSYLRAKEIERQKALVEAKEAESNRLLLNILPETIATELKAHGATKPIRIASATVMFTDFVGFTRISEKLSPEEVVDELDKCFSYFDQVTEKYRLEKLKTIGDSFMCAGGLPTPNKTHAIDCCLAALEIQAFMNQMKEIKHQQGFDYWELRLGMNTGPLVAGVVGHKKFAYDVWGDTVNTASRLESSGVPGKINISLSTYEAVKHLFACEHRGQVKAKNKGDIDMYFLNGIRPELSVNSVGRVPNKDFLDQYRQLREENPVLPTKET